MAGLLLPISSFCWSTHKKRWSPRKQQRWLPAVQQSTPLMDIWCTYGVVYSTLAGIHYRVGLCNHPYKWNLCHPHKTLSPGTDKGLVRQTSIAHHPGLMLAMVLRGWLYKVCSDLCLSCFSISTNNQDSKLRTRLGILVRFHISRISRTYDFDSGLPSMGRHIIQRRSPSPSLWMIE